MSDSTFSRRGFFLAAGGLLGAGLSTAPADAQLLRRRRQQCCPCPCPDPQPGSDCNRIRRNVLSLSTPQLESFKQGVAAMKALPATDPRSWSFQANIHGMAGPATNPLFKQCEHGTLQFFTWHRGYLYYFERILRSASGDPALTLPYWNWTTHPALPDVFRLPALSSNPLYDSTRWMNNGSSLPANVVDTDLANALAKVDFPESGFNGFSPSIEGSPHGAIHGLIGGNMGSVPTAANDPIFWLHHCNIDRIWDQWLSLGGGRANPTSAAFLDKEYSFADETGATVTVKVRDIISGCGLGYRYDDVPPSRAALAVNWIQGQKPMTHELPAQIAASSVAEEKRATPVGQLESKPLGFKTETVKLTAVPAMAAMLKGRPATLAQGTRSKVFVDIEGISLAEVPNFTYAVYLNLPDGATDEQKKAHYLGTVNFFGRDGKGGHDHTTPAAEKTFTESFELDVAIARLARSEKWSADNLTVSLVPITTVPPAGAADDRAALEASAQKANMSYKRVNIRITPER